MLFKMGMLFLAIFHFSERGDFFEENIKENCNFINRSRDAGWVRSIGEEVAQNECCELMVLAIIK